MKPRKLFIFRVIKTGKCGLVRARTIEEAINLIAEHIEQDVEIYRTPNCFSLFVPPWV